MRSRLFSSALNLNRRVTGSRAPASLFCRYLSTPKQEFSDFNQVIHVTSKISKDSVQAFYAHAISCAKDSVMSPGISRYDILCEKDDTSSLLLVEVYNRPSAFEKQINSTHFEYFVSLGDPLLLAPMDLREFKTLYPAKDAWRTPVTVADEKYDTKTITVDPPYDGGLVVVAVDLHIVEEKVEEFITLTRAHCEDCVGASTYSTDDHVLRMDFLQDSAFKQRFKLLIYFTSEEKLAAHKEKETYVAWNEQVSLMSATPRSSVIYMTIFPSLSKHLQLGR